MHDVYKNIDDYNPDKKNSFIDINSFWWYDCRYDKKIKFNSYQIIWRRKLDISLVFITRSYFKVPKYVRLNTVHFFITKIPNKGELNQIANDSSEINTKDFVNIHRKFTSEPYSFLVNDTSIK